MSRPARLQLLFGVFLVALVTLMVELMLIRVFDVVLVDNIGYMVISCALFAFGLSGVYVTLRPLTDHTRIGSYLAWLSVALAAACVLQLPLLNLNPFNLKLIIREPISQVFYFLLIYLTVILPFFFAGLILATAFSVYAAQIRRLYFFDLVGAAIGAVINVPLIRPLGPGGLMFVATALALLAAALFRGRTRFALVAVAAGVVCVALPLSRSDGYYDFRPHIDKRGVMEALEAGDIERTVWDPVSKVDVIPAREDPSVPDRVPAKQIQYDGGSQTTTLFAFDGDFAALRRELDQSVDHASRHFWNRAVPAAHWLKADTGAEVLIIGSAGGQETKAALTYGASRVDAIEMVGAVVDLVTGPYSDYIGGPFRGSSGARAGGRRPDLPARHRQDLRHHPDLQQLHLLEHLGRQWLGGDQLSRDGERLRRVLHASRAERRHPDQSQHLPARDHHRGPGLAMARAQGFPQARRGLRAGKGDAADHSHQDDALDGRRAGAPQRPHAGAQSRQRVPADGEPARSREQLSVRRFLRSAAVGGARGSGRLCDPADHR